MKKILLIGFLLGFVSSGLFCSNLNMIHWGIVRVAFEASQYLQNNKVSKMEVLRKDKQFRKICLRKIGEYGYSALLDSEGNFLIHPDKQIEGKNVFKLKDQTANEIIKKSLPNKFTRGFYKWYSGEKYMCIVPITSKMIQNKKLLLAYSVETKYMDSSYKMNLEESIVHDDEIYYLES